MTIDKLGKYLNRMKWNRLIHKVRKLFVDREVILEFASPVSGVVRVIDIGRERQLEIDGRTHTFILKSGNWGEVNRESLPPVLPDAKETELAPKRDALMKKRGLTTAMAAALEFRQVMASHTDTFARGPYTATEIVAEAEKK